MQQPAFYAFAITSRITADVGHIHLQPVQVEKQLRRKQLAKVLPVHITVNASHRFPQLCNGFVKSWCKPVSPMPYFIGPGTMTEQVFALVTMRIADKEYLFHRAKVGFRMLACNLAL